MTGPAGTAELRVLHAWLKAQRDHVLGVLEGLDEEALRRPVLPSGWHCAGLVQHLALDVERFWFRGVMAGQPAVVDTVGQDTDAWQVHPGVSGGAVLDRYRAEAALADAVIAATTPDTPPAWWPGDLFGDYRLHTLREVMLHVITETAAHAGHLDAVRELLDGRRWLVLDE